MRSRRAPQSPLATVVTYGVLVVLSVFAVFPLVWMLISSVKPFKEIYTFPPSFIPRDAGLHFYERVLGSTPFLTFVVNSTIVTTVATVIGVTFATMAGYGLARYRFRGSRLLSQSILFAYVFPPILLVVPLFAVVSRLGLANTYTGLVLAYVTLVFPFATWLLAAYFRTIPVEIEEAARIDGASNFMVLWRVALPIAAPGIVTAAMFSFINAWVEFLYALVILGGGERRTLSVGLYDFVGGEFAQYGDLMAASAMTLAPMLVFFLIIQRRLVGGLTQGAVRG